MENKAILHRAPRKFTIAACGIGVMAASSFCLLFQAQSSALKTFHDAKYGVTFRYPVQWDSGPSVMFYLGSEILNRAPDGGATPPLGKVGFVVNPESGPYAGTNLNGLQFVYNVNQDSTAGECRKRVEDLANSPVTQATIHGVTYNYFSGGDAGLGHGADRKIYSTFRGGNCYLFEESIHTWNPDAKSLSASEMNRLHRSLDQVMQSVRLKNEP